MIFVTPSSSFELALTREQMHNGMEIEDPIVSNVVASHMDYIIKSQR